MMSKKKILDSIVFDEATGLPIAEDSRGNWHTLCWEYLVDVPNCPRLYFQSFPVNYIWPNTNDYFSIPNTFSGNPKVEYTVPSGYVFHLAFVMASQAKRNNSGNDGISSLGFYVNGNFAAHVPFRFDVHYVLFSPILIHEGRTFEFKLRPFTKQLDFGFVAGGYLVEH